MHEDRKLFREVFEYTLPVSWIVSGEVTVTGENLDKAIENFNIGKHNEIPVITDVSPQPLILSRRGDTESIRDYGNNLTPIRRVRLNAYLINFIFACCEGKSSSILDESIMNSDDTVTLYIRDRVIFLSQARLKDSYKTISSLIDVIESDISEKVLYSKLYEYFDQYEPVELLADKLFALGIAVGRLKYCGPLEAWDLQTDPYIQAVKRRGPI